MRALLGEINVHLADNVSYQLLGSMNKGNLEVERPTILQEMQKASEQLMAQFKAQAQGVPPSGRFILINPQDLRCIMEAELEHLVEAHSTARYTETRQFLLDVISYRYGSQEAARAAERDHIVAGGARGGWTLAAAGRLAATRQVWRNHAARCRSLQAMLRLIIAPQDP